MHMSHSLYDNEDFHSKIWIGKTWHDHAGYDGDDFSAHKNSDSTR